MKKTTNQQDAALQLATLRSRIDDLDEQLVRLLNQRASIAQEVGAVKKTPMKFSPAREAEVVARAKQLNAGPLTDVTIEAVMREVISGCLNLEQPMNVSYLGPVGTYSEEAARKRFGTAATLVPCASIDEAVRTVEGRAADVAVVPIENSIEGSVGRTLDILLTTSLQICDEIQLPIHHQLLAKGGTLQDITEVVAHPQALAQCREWLTRHLPQTTQTAAASNGEAARLAGEQTGRAAIAGTRAAHLYGLSVLAASIEDDPSNTTRFLVLGAATSTPTGADRTSLVCSVPHKAGSLQEVLGIFAEQGVNLVKLESRPAPQGLWEYMFYIDIDGHQDDDMIACALGMLKERATFVKIIGSYPKAV